MQFPPSLRALFALTGASACLATSVAAQVVRGAVTDRASKAPIAGVVLSLVDEAGRTLVATLSDERGGYELRAPAAGRFAIVVKRIGVRPTRIPSFDLAIDETRREAIEVEPFVASLGTVRVTERAACKAPRDGDARLVALWEDTRAALTAAVITAERAERGLITRFERDVDGETGRVVKDRRSSSLETMERLFRSLPADQLAADGYVVHRGDGATDYYAPDAHVLLSDEFVATHCFRVTAGVRDRAAQVGLAFSPTRERVLPDVGGTLWLDRRTSELRDVEFFYTSLGPGAPSEPERIGVGGRVHFTRLRDGRWIVDDWRIRMPLVVTSGPAGEVRVAVFKETGGTVTLERRRPEAERAKVVDASAPPEAVGATVAGTVYDSVAARPVGGVTVVLDGTDFSATSDAEGRFAIRAVPPGTYAVSVAAPALDSLALRLPPWLLTVRGNEPVIARVALPSTRTRATLACGDRVDLSREAIVRMRVHEGSGEPLRNAALHVSWRFFEQRASALAEVVRGIDVTLDRDGETTLCDVPAGTFIVVEPPADAPVRWRDSLRVDAGTLVRRVVMTRPVQLAAATSHSKSERADSSRTGGDRGRSRGRVRSRFDEDTATINALRRAGARGPALFEEHRSMGRGIFLDDAELRLRDASRMVDLLRRLPGLRLVSLPSGGNAVASGIPPSTNQLAMIARWEMTGEIFQPACYLQVYLDGSRMWTWSDQPPIDVNTFDPSTIGALELYRSAADAPPEWNATGAVCGTVAFWTRRR